MFLQKAIHLKTRVGFVLAVAIVFPLILLNYLGFTAQERNIQASVSYERQQVMRLLALSIQEPLWNLNRAAGSPIVSAAIQDPNIISIRVIDGPSHSVFLSASVKSRQSGPSLTLSQPVTFRGEDIGQIFVEFDASTSSRIRLKWFHFVIYMAMAQLLLLGLALFGIYRLWIKPPYLSLLENLKEIHQDKPTVQWIESPYREWQDLIKALQEAQVSVEEQARKQSQRIEVLESDLVQMMAIESSVRQQAHLYQQLVVHSAEGWVLTDKKGQIVEVNAAFLALLGLTMEQMRLQNIWTLIASDFKAIETQHQARIHRLNYSPEFASCYIDRLGRLIQTSTQLIHVEDDSGQFWGVWRRVRLRE